MITVSEEALEEISWLRQQQGLDQSYFLRLGVKGGGCSGLIYTTRFDNCLRSSDRLFSFSQERVVVDMKSFLFLDGTNLVVEHSSSGARLVFDNPQAIAGCCCLTAAKNGLSSCP